MSVPVHCVIKEYVPESDGAYAITYCGKTVNTSLVHFHSMDHALLTEMKMSCWGTPCKKCIKAFKELFEKTF